MTSRTHDNFRHNFWTWVHPPFPPPVWTMLKKTALFWKEGFPNCESIIFATKFIQLSRHFVSCGGNIVASTPSLTFVFKFMLNMQRYMFCAHFFLQFNLHEIANLCAHNFGSTCKGLESFKLGWDQLTHKVSLDRRQINDSTARNQTKYQIIFYADVTVSEFSWEILRLFLYKTSRQ